MHMKSRDSPHKLMKNQIAENMQPDAFDSEVSGFCMQRNAGCMDKVDAAEVAAMRFLDGRR